MEANLTTNVATAIQQSQIKNESALAVAQKTLQIQKQQGEAAVDLVKQVAQLTAQLANGRVDVEL
jgi:enterochelin esterase-like enzyme